MQPRQTDAVDQFVAREANGYKAEGFSRQRVIISMNRNEESKLPVITSMQSISRRGRPRGPLSTERVGCAVMALPSRTPAIGARRVSAAGSEEPEADTDVSRRRDAPRPVLRASEGGGGGEQ